MGAACYRTTPFGVRLAGVGAITRPPGYREGWVGGRGRRRCRRCANGERWGEYCRRGCGGSATITEIGLAAGPRMRRCGVPRDRCANNAGDRVGGSLLRSLPRAGKHLLFASDTTPGNAGGGVVAQHRERRRGHCPIATPCAECTRPPVRGSAQLAGVPLPAWGGSRTALPSVRSRSPKADTTPPAYTPMYSRCAHGVLTAQEMRQDVARTRPIRPFGFAGEGVLAPTLYCLTIAPHGAYVGCLVPCQLRYATGVSRRWRHHTPACAGFAI